MRKLLILAAAACLLAGGLAAASTASAAQPAAVERTASVGPSPDSVTVVCDNGPRVFVYENGNFGGSSKYFCGYINVPNLANVGHSGYCFDQELPFTGSWADCISSYQSFGMTGHWLCFYTNSNYVGLKEGYGTNARVPQVTHNDQIISIRWKTSAC